MFELITGLLGGGVTGLLGTGISKFVEFINQRRADKHEIEMARLEQETMRLEHEGKIKIAVEESEAKKSVAATEADAEKYLADMKALKASFDADRASYLTGKVEGTKFTSFVFTIIDGLRGSVRPLITYYIALVLTIMAWKVFTIANSIEGSFTPEQAHDLLRQILSALIYIGTTVILWWFGTRPTTKPPRVGAGPNRNLGKEISESLKGLKIK